MARKKFLYSSTSKSNLKYLRPAPLPLSEGFNKRERGVWATDDLILSRAFGIDRKKFGTFYLDPLTRHLTLVNWKFSQIPKSLVAYTYYVDRKGFNRVGARNWKFVRKRKTSVLRVETYNLRSELVKYFCLSEVTQRSIRPRY